MNEKKIFKGSNKIKVRYLFLEEIKFMSLNKNKIFRIAAFIISLFGTALILIGYFMYRDYAIGFYIGGAGFYVVAWAFNALKGRI